MDDLPQGEERGGARGSFCLCSPGSDRSATTRAALARRDKADAGTMQRPSSFACWELLEETL